MGRLPNFILAGFPKCGSTSLYYYLGAHPDIFVPRQKELHYFTSEILCALNKGEKDKEVLRFHIDTLEGYKACYEEATDEKMVGDISPSYANYPEVHSTIKATLGQDIKVLVLVRDPVQRAYSNYLHLVREDRERLGFYEALKAEADRKEQGYSDFWYYTFNSFYADKIDALKRSFPQVKVVTFEALIADLEAGIRDIYRFLGVDDSFVPPNLGTAFNPGGVYKKNPITRFIFGQSRLKSFIKERVPIAEGMKNLKIKVISRFKQSTPPIPEEARAYLDDLFDEEIRRLKEEQQVATHYWKS